MMIPDVDDMIICSKCGGRIFYENPVYSYDKHPKLKGTWVRVPKMIDLVCRKCGQKEMVIPYERIHETIKPRS